MSPFVPLLAAVDVALLKLVTLMVLFLLAGIAQLVAKLKKVQPPPGRPRPVQADVADEIEEFMRRAARRRDAPGTQSAPAPTPRAAEPVRAEVVAEQPVGGQVEQHVKKYLDAEDFSRRSQELGEEVAQVDREVDQHLHEVFDHGVSRLAVAPGEAAAPPAAIEPSELGTPAPEIPATFATGLLELVSSPDSLRQAIILNEILHRPEERWG